MKFYKRRWRESILAVLFISNIFVWLAVYERQPSQYLTVRYLDIGQGDSILIDSPTHGRILIDGGPNSKVLSELGKVMPFGDRRIDVMIETHPDSDHIGGLVDVAEQYNVGTFLEPGVESPNKIDDLLHSILKTKNIPRLLARRGMVVNLGDGAKLEILFPNQDVSNWETNDASVVAKLTYGNKSFLFTGDSTKKSEYLLLSMYPSTSSGQNSTLESTVLKVGHHGSKYSTSLSYAKAVSPTYAVISAGANNRYGHPAKEVLDILNSLGTKIFATETAGGLTGMGTITFKTDGESLTFR